ncbi:hypothetical protein AAIR98_001965 [Elusimicrobium simillimum]|uniref:hypothetical protein n=1 Tax=Elusimicrobium simillimum TaxID=3143438 RepID=UPI003C6F7E00
MKRVLLIIMLSAFCFGGCDFDGAVRPKTPQQRRLFAEADKSFYSTMLPLDKYFTSYATASEKHQYETLKKQFNNALKKALQKPSQEARDAETQNATVLYQGKIQKLQQTVKNRNIEQYLSNLASKNKKALEDAEFALGPAAATQIKEAQNKLMSRSTESLKNGDGTQSAAAYNDFIAELATILQKYAKEGNQRDLEKIFSNYSTKNVPPTAQNSNTDAPQPAQSASARPKIGQQQYNGEDYTNIPAILADKALQNPLNTTGVLQNTSSNGGRPKVGQAQVPVPPERIETVKQALDAQQAQAEQLIQSMFGPAKVQSYRKMFNAYKQDLLGYLAQPHTEAELEEELAKKEIKFGNNHENFIITEIRNTTVKEMIAQSDAIKAQNPVLADRIISLQNECVKNVNETTKQTVARPPQLDANGALVSKVAPYQAQLLPVLNNYQAQINAVIKEYHEGLQKDAMSKAAKNFDGMIAKDAQNIKTQFGDADAREYTAIMAAFRSEAAAISLITDPAQAKQKEADLNNKIISAHESFVIDKTKQHLIAASIQDSQRINTPQSAQIAKEFKTYLDSAAAQALALPAGQRAAAFSNTVKALTENYKNSLNNPSAAQKQVEQPAPPVAPVVLTSEP